MPGLAKVRSAVASDIPVILTFVRELAEFERLLDRVLATEALLHEHLFGVRPYAESLIAEVDGEPQGFAIFFHNFSTFLGRPGIFLEDLYVRQSARGHGVGFALLRRIAQIAVERNCQRVDWAVLDWNSRAIEFYERIGARPESDWNVYRLNDEALKALAWRSGHASDT